MIQTTHGKAYGAFVALSQIRGGVRGMDALHVFHLRNMLRENVEFLSEEEQRLVAEAGGVITDTGMVMIADAAKKVAYLHERMELDRLPCEIQTEPIRIRIDRCPDVTAEQIEAMDGFVIFEEGESNGND